MRNVGFYYKNKCTGLPSNTTVYFIATQIHVSVHDKNMGTEETKSRTQQRENLNRSFEFEMNTKCKTKIIPTVFKIVVYD